MIEGQVKGLLELQKKGEQVVADLTSGEFLDTMRECTVMVHNTAKEEAPVDTGRLRASITPEVRVNGNIIEGVVGSNVTYAPYMELGTGVFAGKARYFPPPSALNVWARRHGMGSGFAVAMAIYRAGGTKGRHFLQKGFDQNESRIKTKLDKAVTRIVLK